MEIHLTLLLKKIYLCGSRVDEVVDCADLEDWQLLSQNETVINLNFLRLYSVKS